MEIEPYIFVAKNHEDTNEIILQKVEVTAEKLQLPEKEKARLQEKISKQIKSLKRNRTTANSSDSIVKQWKNTNKKKKLAATKSPEKETNILQDGTSPHIPEYQDSHLEKMGLDEITDSDD